MQVVMGALVAVVPFALTFALLALAGWRERRRLAAVVRQIRLTDAIHSRVGATVAPVVRRRLDGRWEVRVPVPFERHEVVEGVLAAVREIFASAGATPPEPFEVVLSQQPKWPAALLRAAGPIAPVKRESPSWT